jgi:ubiquinone/menaquinone biosynthesis C-methylase UbiE
VKGIVAAGYDRVASRYAELEAPGREWPRMRWLDEVLSRLPDRSEVLDVGCGNGLPATRAIAERHRVTGVDISSKQIELARHNVPEARLIHGDAASVEFPAASFDAIVAFYVLEHLPPATHDARLVLRLDREKE